MSFKPTSDYQSVDPAVTQMAPPMGIQDPQVATYLQAFHDAWNQRNGMGGDPSKKFLTRDEVLQESLGAVSRVFAVGVDGIPTPYNVPTNQEVQNTIANLQDAIRKSLIYQALENAIGSIDLNNVKADIDSALGSAYAAVGSEIVTRTSQDMALASAINNIWAKIGGATAVINDGGLASATATTASATKWTQVVASVTDPNTGLVNSTSIKQDLNSYASAANGTFNSIYSVRAQVSTAGQTIVGGFGLSATAGAGSSPGSNIAFGVRADQFFIAATSSTPDGTTQENQGNTIPFMALTSSQYVNGVLYAPGVFIKTATIGDATIGTAKIADASITNAKIGFAIQSANWNGVNLGWYLDKNGYFYVFNVYARGDIMASSLVADTVYAGNIVSDSLNQFFTTLTGTFSFTVGVGAKAVRLSCAPGNYASGGSGGKDGGTDFTNRSAFILIDGVGQTQAYVIGSGSCYWYGVSAGTHTLRVEVGGGTLFTGRIYVDIIAR